MEVLSTSLPFFTRPLYSASSTKTGLSLLFPRNLSPNLHCQFLNLLFLKHRTASYRFSSWGRYTEEEKEVEYSFEEAVQLFNDKEYYKCHDVLEALWNNSEEPKRTLVHGILQCAVGLYHLFNQNHKGAMMELGEGLCKLRKMNFKNGPLQQFEKDISAVLDFIHQTQLELAACTEEFCLTMDQSERSYQLLGGYAAGQPIYRVDKDQDNFTCILFHSEISHGGSEHLSRRIKLPKLLASEDHICNYVSL